MDRLGAFFAGSKVLTSTSDNDTRRWSEIHPPAQDDGALADEDFDSYKEPEPSTTTAINHQQYEYVNGHAGSSLRSRFSKPSDLSDVDNDSSNTSVKTNNKNEASEGPGLDKKTKDAHLDAEPPRLDVTWTLPLLVFVDMFAVSLVIPILLFYFKEAGVTSANQREVLSSFYSMAQIVGGVCMGIFKDAMGVPGRTLLLVSFGGSALSYAMIAYSTTTTTASWGLGILMASRVLVGFVKQTMTVTTTLLTAAIANDKGGSETGKKTNRAKYLGRLRASATMSWIAGPSIGAFLYKYVHPQTPALLASALFLVNIVLVIILLPQQQQQQDPSDAAVPNASGSRDVNSSSASPDTVQDSLSESHHDPASIVATLRRIAFKVQSNLRVAFGSRELGVLVLCRLIFIFVWRATSHSQLGSFYEDLFQLQSPHFRGFISSYQQIVQFVVQAMLVHPILRLLGCDNADSALRTTACALCFGRALSYVLLVSFPFMSFYLGFVLPASWLCFAMIRVSLETLTTHAASQTTMFSVLAVLDILENIVGVTVPFYRTVLFKYLSKDGDADGSSEQQTLMEGDPDPISWLLSSGTHWLVAAVIMTVLFSSSTLTITAKSNMYKAKAQ